MDYWAETMQDDCYLIAADGWKVETVRIIETDKIMESVSDDVTPAAWHRKRSHDDRDRC
jgi:hypothetical protein